MSHFRQEPTGKQDGSAGIEKNPMLSITRIARTKAAKAASIIASLVLIFGMTAPSPVGAWGYWNSDHPRYDDINNIGYCFEQTGGWNNTALNVIRNAFEHWDGYMNRKSITEVSQGIGCHIHVSVVSGGQVIGNAIARGLPWAIGDSIVQGDLLFNANYTSQFWMYGASQNCYVGVNCAKPYDLWTIALHEIGHTIGLGHNTTTTPALCQPNGFVDNPAASCTQDWYSVDPMYWAAADGYRRWIEADSLAGLVGLGYRW